MIGLVVTTITVPSLAKSVTRTKSTGNGKNVKNVILMISDGDVGTEDDNDSFSHAEPVSFVDHNANRNTPSYRYVGGQATWDAILAGTLSNDADGDGDVDN
jgi:alkaline phosphatase